MADYNQSLDFIKTILENPAAFEGGKPKFSSVTDMDKFLTEKGFKLPDGNNTKFGPPADPDARQLVYQGPGNVIIKVKTAGYESGPRAGRATMSIEVTDGKGTAWENTLFKVDAGGKVIAKNVIDSTQTIVQIRPGEWGVKRADGQVGKIVQWEVIQGGKAPPFDKQAWADRGHLDLPAQFNRTGAASIGKSSTSPHPLPPKPFPSVSGSGVGLRSRISGIVGNQSAMAMLGQLLGSAIQGIGDIGIRQNVENELKTTYAAAIEKALSEGKGILVIIRMQEWAIPDFNGMRARALMNVFIETGSSQADALTKWRQPKYLSGPPEGWRTYEEYRWIDPK